MLGGELKGVVALLKGIKDNTLKEKMLLATNSNLDTPLMLSLKLGTFDIFLYLLGHTLQKDNLCSIDSQGNTLLHIAATLSN